VEPKGERKEGEKEEGKFYKEMGKRIISER
jgi:hypothetical protein